MASVVRGALGAALLRGGLIVAPVLRRLVMVCAALLLGSGALAQTTERVSVASDGTEGDGADHGIVISGNGRFVVFHSWSSNLVEGDSNGRRDVFVHDRGTGITERVSVASDGTEADLDSNSPAISADGRFVAFFSHASNLVPGVTALTFNIFVHDRETGITEHVNVASDGTVANNFSIFPAISADGRFVAFDTIASNLVADDMNERNDVYVRDRELGTTERVSIASDGDPTGGGGIRASISGDGRFVAFYSNVNDLVLGDENGLPDVFSHVFVHDREAGTTERVSVASDGAKGNALSFNPAISADGRFVAFNSGATNLVEGDTNGETDFFVHDREAGTTERVSVASDGTQGNGESGGASISADGRFVGFSSLASNLVAGDTNGTSDSFVHDRESGVTERVSLANDGTEGNNASGAASISGNGRFAAFNSSANNLVSGDTNDLIDVFVRDRAIPPHLSIAGACPGSVSLSLTTATSFGSVAFGSGTSEGSVTLPPGPCAGTELGLADPNLLAVLTADLAGSISLDRTVGAGACGLFLQAVDVTSCIPSNVASVP